MKAETNGRKLVLLFAVAALLLAVTVLASSCGGTGGTTSGQAGKVIQPGPANIDIYVNQLDTSMNSVGPNDFDDKNLSDSELGL